MLAYCPKLRNTEPPPLRFEFMKRSIYSYFLNTFAKQASTYSISPGHMVAVNVSVVFQK